MKTASTRATNISRATTHMVRWRAASLILITAIVLAACAPTPPKPEPAACPTFACPACPQCPPPKPPPESARYLEAGFDSLPGWSQTSLAPSLRAFIASCPKNAALARACDAARAIPADDEAAARQFFEAMFQPLAVVSSDGPDTGLITGYYEPVIEGSRARTAKNRHPIFGVPDDLLVVDLGA